MSRSVAEAELFRDDADRRVFRRLLRNQLKETGYKVIQATLQSNHYHLVIRASERPLADLLHTVHSQYARYYNKKYNRRGTLFDGRPKSIVIASTEYAMTVIGYVSRNPWKHKDCASMAELDRKRWCGHTALMGYETEIDFIDTNAALKLFGAPLDEARGAYLALVEKQTPEQAQEYVEELISRCNREVSHYDDITCSVIGGDAFTKRFVRIDHENRMRLSELKRLGWDLDTLAAHVATCVGVDRKWLRLRCARGELSRARQAFAYMAYRTMGVSQVEIGRYLGVSGAAVSSMVARGEAVAEAHGVTKIPTEMPTDTSLSGSPEPSLAETAEDGM
jgi:REP element-mobilizing transposase RayT